MQEMKEKETARRKSLEDRRESLGLSQAFELGKRSTEEYVPITLLRETYQLTMIPADAQRWIHWNLRSSALRGNWTSHSDIHHHDSSRSQSRRLTPRKPMATDDYRTTALLYF